MSNEKTAFLKTLNRFEQKQWIKPLKWIFIIAVCASMFRLGFILAAYFGDIVKLIKSFK